ncbi:hypothetical protein ANN_18229 [Periplaneta americana]|uniref:Uncharacterized protein n=1 Tax=Periplaneta americana TaxID=6978 RepID=A0ABQ8SN64_PERAM|nr:hypothetical protein ANN_18229 [Periplaneta americana]
MLKKIFEAKRDEVKCISWETGEIKPLGRPRRRCNIKMDLREVGYDDSEWINLAQPDGSSGSKGDVASPDFSVTYYAWIVEPLKDALHLILQSDLDVEILNVRGAVNHRWGAARRVSQLLVLHACVREGVRRPSVRNVLTSRSREEGQQDVPFPDTSQRGQFAHWIANTLLHTCN